MKNFVYEIAVSTDRGTVKKENEDSCFVGKTTDGKGTEIVFALVADGLGGTAWGKQASNLVRDTFQKWFLTQLPNLVQKPVGMFEETLLSEWKELLNQCHRELSQKKKSAGSTLTMLFLYGGTFYALNIGDSRIYRYSNGRLYQITKDHSWAQMALEQGLTAKEIEADSRRHSLTRCIGGGAKSAKADYFADFYMDTDCFLLCSDGLRHLVSVQELTSCLTVGQLEEQLQNVIEIAKLRGETDNLTGIAIQVWTAKE